MALFKPKRPTTRPKCRSRRRENRVHPTSVAPSPRADELKVLELTQAAGKARLQLAYCQYLSQKALVPLSRDLSSYCMEMADEIGALDSMMAGSV